MKFVISLERLLQIHFNEYLEQSYIFTLIASITNYQLIDYEYQTIR